MKPTETTPAISPAEEAIKGFYEEVETLLINASQEIAEKVRLILQNIEGQESKRSPRRRALAEIKATVLGPVESRGPEQYDPKYPFGFEIE